MDEGRPIFAQIAEQIESSIIDGTLAEEAQVPSTNELAAFHRINPATAAKGINQLVDDGILYKKRGIGMFVSSGARAKLRHRRREQFSDQYLAAAARRGRQARPIHDGDQEHDRFMGADPMSAIVTARRTCPSGSAARSLSTTCRFTRAGEHDLRPARPQRRRQDHADADPDRPGCRHLRRGRGVRALRRTRMTPSSAESAS